MQKPSRLLFFLGGLSRLVFLEIGVHFVFFDHFRLSPFFEFLGRRHLDDVTGNRLSRLGLGAGFNAEKLHLEEEGRIRRNIPIAIRPVGKIRWNK